MRRGVVMLFAKEAVVGRVKTRLVPALTAVEAAALYESFVEDVLATLGLAAGERLDVEIHADGAHDASLLRGLAVVRPQVGGALGERLFHAFDGAVAQGRAYAIVVGADHPALRASALAALADAMEAGGEAVIIPSEDGGYCALGLARPRWEFFDGVPWSTAGVLAATIARLRASGIEPHLLDPCFDVDVPGDLERLAREIADRDPREADFPRRTAIALAVLGSRAGVLGAPARPLQEPARGPGVTGLAYPSEKGVLQ